MKRVLIISYYWPPSGGSGVQRWVKFAKFLPEYGWKPVIYTPENPDLTIYDHSLMEEVSEEAEIVRRRIFEPYRVLRALGGRRKYSAEKHSNAPDAVVTPINSQKKSFLQNMVLWIRGNFFIPDPRCLWILPSAGFLKKYLREHPVDIIVSTGPPHSMHLIARRVALATGIPWVADFRDPWTKMFYFKHLKLTALSRRIHCRLEKKVLDDATVVVSVTPRVQEEFRSMTSTPVELITNGYDEADFANALEVLGVSEQEFGSENDIRFTIVHTGVFASDGNPETLWKVLAKIAGDCPEFREKLQIRLVGKTDIQIVESIEAAGLGRNTENLGYVSHETAVLEQCKASVLILPLRKEPEYKSVLPGKLFEYLASRRPVIGIGDPDSVMAKFVEDAKAGRTYDWDDAAGLENEIRRCWALFREGKLPDSKEDIEKYSRRRLCRTMAGLFDSLKK